MSRISEAIKYADLIIRKLVAVKPGEEVLIVVDTQTDPEMYHALAGATSAVGADWTIAMQTSRPVEESGKVNKAVIKAIEGVDVCIFATRTCLPYGLKLPPEISTKIRTVWMVMRGLDNMVSGGATADYDAMQKVIKKLQKVLESGSEIRLTTELGTDLTFSKEEEGHSVKTESGFATEPGSFTAFSEGEVYLAPDTGSAEGVVIVDGPIAHIGPLPKPIKLIVKKGHIVKVEGKSAQAHEFRRLITTIENADQIGEFAIGTNPKCIRRGDFEEDKKALGNIHLAYGAFLRGCVTEEEREKYASPIHGDIVVFDAKVELDGKTILKNGKLYI